NASGRSKVAIILDEDAADLRGCSVLIVGRGFDNDRYTARRITLVNNFIETRSFVPFASSPFNRPFDVIVWHALPARRLDRAPQTRVPGRITATGFGGNGYFLGEFAEDLSAFRVDRAFETLDLRPFTVSRHTAELCFLDLKVA